MRRMIWTGGICASFGHHLGIIWASFVHHLGRWIVHHRKTASPDRMTLRYCSTMRVLEKRSTQCGLHHFAPVHVT
jgi:hypothetical protein